MKSQKAYIKGNSERGLEVIEELTKLGAYNIYDHYGDVDFIYYYIDCQDNIRSVEDVNLLKGLGYKEIKLPQKDVFPFSSSDELEKACQEHGNMVRNKCGISLFDIGRIISLIGSYHSDEETYRHLLDFYEFHDGTPCGIVVRKQQ